MNDTDETQRLDEFRRAVRWNLKADALTGVRLPVIGNEGAPPPVVVALDGDLLAVVLEQIWSTGGCTNLFVRDEDGRVHLASVVPAEDCSLNPDDDIRCDVEADPTVGTLLHCASVRPDGFVISLARKCRCRCHLPDSDTRHIVACCPPDLRKRGPRMFVSDVRTVEIRHDIERGKAKIEADEL